MMNSNIILRHQTLPTTCRLEWVNFPLETCGAGCIYTTIPKAVAVPAPPPPHRQLQAQCSSVPLPCQVCSASFAPRQLSARNETRDLNYLLYLKYESSLFVAITELKRHWYVQSSTSSQRKIFKGSGPRTQILGKQILTLAVPRLIKRFSWSAPLAPRPALCPAVSSFS